MIPPVPAKPPPTSLPPPPKAADIQKLLDPKLLYREGKGGLKVVSVHDGVIVAMFNKDGLQVRLNAAAKAEITNKLSTRYPAMSLGAVFGREGERERLALGMRSRLKTVSGADPGRYVGVESLDKSRPIPSASSITPDKHSIVPRHVTWVRLEPPPATRFIAISEKQMDVLGQKKRPDEVFVSYEITQKELDQISVEQTDSRGRKIRVDSGTSFSELKEVETENLKIHVGDPNLEISESSAKKHFTKTLAYLEATLDTLTKGGPLTKGATPMPKMKLPVGAKVLLSARDVYMSPAFLKLGASGFNVARWVRDLRGLLDGKAIKDLGPNSVIHFSAEYERKPSGWKLIDSLDNVSGKLGKAGLRGLAGTLEQLLSPKTIDALLNVLKRHT